jgi:hypothetical protein
MSFSVPLTSFFNDVKICVTSYSVNQQLSLSRTPKYPRHWSVTNLHTLSDQYHWVLWNTHHTKLTFVTPIDKLSSFLLIFELFFPYLWRHSSMTSKYVSRHISYMGCLMKETHCTFNEILVRKAQILVESDIPGVGYIFKQFGIVRGVLIRCHNE